MVLVALCHSKRILGSLHGTEGADDPKVGLSSLLRKRRKYIKTFKFGEKHRVVDGVDNVDKEIPHQSLSFRMHNQHMPQDDVMATGLGGFRQIHGYVYWSVFISYDS